MAVALTQISGYAHVAARYGFEEAVFLDSIVYWYRTNRANNRNFRDGRWWTYNSVKAFEEVFPWWSGKQIRRIANSCRDQGALIAGEYNEDRRVRSLWYTPGDELLKLYGIAETGNCTCPNGQMHEPEGASGCAQTGECNIRNSCTYHGDTDMIPPNPPAGDAPPDSVPADKPAPKPRREKSTPAHDPDAFETFWAAYPRKDDRRKAIRAWDKLKPDKPLCRVMYTAMLRQKTSPQWTRDGGQYIPMFPTWLNGRRWEDQGVDPALLPRPKAEPVPGALVYDPEVTR